MWHTSLPERQPMANTVGHAGDGHVAHSRNERRQRQTRQPHRWRPRGARLPSSDSQWQIRWAARGGGYVAHSRSKRRHNGRANHTGGSHVARAAPLATSNADMVDRAGGSRVPGSHNERRPMGKRSAQHSSTAAQQPRQGRRRRRPGAGTYAGHTSYGTAWAPANADASTASRRPSRRHACVRRPSATAAAAAAETHAAAAAGASTTASASPRQIGRRTMC